MNENINSIHKNLGGNGKKLNLTANKNYRQERMVLYEQDEEELRPIRVLLIEDNQGDAHLIQDRLRDASVSTTFDVVHVSRLSKGLESLNTDIFDIILLDLNLPDSKGEKTFTQILKQAKGISIVILTGLADERLVERLLREGAQDYLIKDQVSTNTLVRSIRHAKERKNAEERLQKQTHVLSKRVKELTCLYELSKLLREVELSLKNVFQKIITLIPQTW